MTKTLRKYDGNAKILANQDNKVAETARHWLGTPFRHQGRVKGVGVDCLGLLIGVAEELQLRGRDGQLLAKADALNYGHVPDAARLAAGLEQNLSLWERSTSPRGRGLIALFEIDGTARHVGIITPQQTLLHAYAPARKVVEHRLDDNWRGRIVKLYDVPMQSHLAKLNT